MYEWYSSRFVWLIWSFWTCFELMLDGGSRSKFFSDHVSSEPSRKIAQNGKNCLVKPKKAWIWQLLPFESGQPGMLDFCCIFLRRAVSWTLLESNFLKKYWSYCYTVLGTSNMANVGWRKKFSAKLNGFNKLFHLHDFEDSWLFSHQGIPFYCAMRL